MPKMEVSINDNIATVTYERNRVKHTKTLSLDTFVNAIGSQRGLRIPSLLPAGCRFYMEKNGQHFVYLEVPPIPRLIRYTNRTDKPIFEGVVAMPWALVEVVLQGTETGGYTPIGGRVFALKRPLASETDELFHFPAANIHHDHRVCWGSTFREMGTLKSLSEVGRAVDYFFSSEFNTDIHPHLNGYQRWEDLLRDTKDQKTFPVNVLASTGYRLQSIIS